MRRAYCIMVILCLLAVGCASSRSGQVYSRDQARKEHTVEMGTVEQVVPAQIEGTKSPVGVLAGAGLGGALGSSIGHGAGTTIAVAVGAVAGGLAGAAAEEEMTKKEGFEITVKLDNGKTLAVVQEADEAFVVGDRVRVLKSSDGTTRVRH